MTPWQWLFHPDKREADHRKSPAYKKISKIEPKKPDWDHIPCPYCFEEFSHKDVHFRSTTIKEYIPSEVELKQMYGNDKIRFEHEMKKADIAKKFVRQAEDQKLSEFWEERFHINADQREQDRPEYPVIEPGDKSMLYHEDEKSLIYTDGFLGRVKDYFGHVSTDRLCPYCHNRLSPTYGKYRILFMSIVGITGSGKTVYLNMLMESLKKHLSMAGLAAVSTYDIWLNDPIRKGGFLPESTQEGILYDPMIVDVVATHEDGTKETFTMAFYDIAGENCVDQNRLYNFGPYLQRSEAIIMLMDPKQFPELCPNTEASSVSNIIETLGNFYEVSGLPKSERPYMAAVLSKSDQLKKLTKGFMMEGILSDQSVIFQNIRKNNAHRGFYTKSYNAMCGAMISLLKTIDPDDVITAPLKEIFKETAFFAVSSLGSDLQAVYNIGTLENPVYVDIDDDTENFITMIMTGHNSRKMRLRNQSIYLGTHPKTHEKVVWTYEDILQHQLPVEYIMASAPESCRLEEPIMWILYKLGFIAGVDA